MKLLFSAYCCAPQSTSEQGFGWWWATRCAERHEVTVVTSLAAKPQIQSYLDKNPTNIQFEFVRGPSRVSHSGTEYRFERIRQYLWQLRAALSVKRLLERENFDLAQHVTIGSWRLPSCFAFGSVPYIFGPTSGSEKIPPSFLLHLSVRGSLWEIIRAALIVLARWDPLVKRSLGRAARILATGPATYAEMMTRYPAKTFAATRAFQKADISARWKPRTGQVSAANPLNISWMGRLIPRKGLNVLIHALADSRLEDVALRVIGDGPMKGRYKHLATTLRVSDRIQFLGNLSQLEALTRIRTSDIFVFTSLRDMMGQSLSEAMQLGVPCLALDWSGPAWLVGENGAYKVEVTTFKKTCIRLSDALLAVRDDSALRQRLSDLARARIRFLTDPKRQDEEIDAVFKSVMKMKI